MFDPRQLTLSVGQLVFLHDVSGEFFNFFLFKCRETYCAVVVRARYLGNNQWREEQLHYCKSQVGYVNALELIWTEIEERAEKSDWRRSRYSNIPALTYLCES